MVSIRNKDLTLDGLVPKTSELKRMLYEAERIKHDDTNKPSNNSASKSIISYPNQDSNQPTYNNNRFNRNQQPASYQNQGPSLNACVTETPTQ